MYDPGASIFIKFFEVHYANMLKSLGIDPSVRMIAYGTMLTVMLQQPGDEDLYGDQKFLHSL